MSKSAAIGRLLLRRVLQIIGMVAISAGLFYAAAGRFDLPGPLIGYSVALAYLLASGAIMIRKHPEVVAARAKPRSKDTKPWDRRIMSAMLLPGIATPVVAGLDVGRFEWARFDLWLMIPGLAGYLTAVVFMQWAIAANKHFEKTVRIQSERKHVVATNGPYRIVRHPGYLGMLVQYFTWPLVLGSAWALVPAAASAVLMIIRTSLEDRTLRLELEGYAEYASRTRYRLIPWVW